VYITRASIQIYGETTDRSTYSRFRCISITFKLTYLRSCLAGNKVSISRNMPASIAGSDDASATVRISREATNVKRTSRFVVSGFYTVFKIRFSLTLQYTTSTLRIPTENPSTSRRLLLSQHKVPDSEYTDASCVGIKIHSW
jgi:hypothetical protein